MDFALAREIYGNMPWMVDKTTFSALFNMLIDFRNGTKFPPTAERLNSFHIYAPSTSSKYVYSPSELKSDTILQSDLIYIMNLNGPILKSSGMSTIGMEELSQNLADYEADSRVIGGIIVVDSGGGSGAGMELMQYAINNKTKPIVSFIKRNGTAASAAYGIISQTDKIISDGEFSSVGSIGTMLSFQAHPNKSISGDGKQVTIYATKSTSKNLWYEEALNNDNYDVAISEVLDPFNERFIKSVLNKRPFVLDSQLDGSDYDTGEVVGTLIDEIGTWKDAIDTLIALSGKNSNNLQTIKNKAMTAEKLQSEHLEVYNSIVGSGVTKERERVATWMAHFNTDPEKVKTGVLSGNELSASVREELLIKAASTNHLSQLNQDSAPPLDTPESKLPTSPTEQADAAEAKNVYGKFIK